jgi:hypothetical protein
MTHKDWDQPALHQKSMRLMAEQVMPRFRRHLDGIKKAS